MSHECFQNICVYAYTYVCRTAMNEKRGYEFEREQGGVKEGLEGGESRGK